MWWPKTTSHVIQKHKLGEVGNGSIVLSQQGIYLPKIIKIGQCLITL